MRSIHGIDCADCRQIIIYNYVIIFDTIKPPRDSIKIDLGGLKYNSAEVRIVDNDRNFEPEALENGTLVLDGNSFALVSFKL